MFSSRARHRWPRIIRYSGKVNVGQIPKMSLSNTTAWERNLRTLTVEAGQAAELGRWDQTEECYRLRAEQLYDYPMPPALATDLAVYDQEITARILTVRLAVQSQLIEATKIRQNLQGVRSWQGLNEIAHPLMDRLA
jgi:hypothetical protein